MIEKIPQDSKNNFYPEEERKSGVSRIFGADKEEEGLLKFFEEELKNKSRLEKEIEHPPGFDEMIQGVNKYLQEFLTENYQVKPINMPPENFHMLPEKEKEKFGEKDKDAGGVFFPATQHIVVFYEDGQYNLKTLARCVHELIHFNSYQTFLKTDEEIKNREDSLKLIEKRKESSEEGEEKESVEEKNIFLYLRKIGVQTITKRGKIYFEKLNEVISEELTKRFIKKYASKIKFVQEEWKETQETIERQITKGKDPKKFEDVLLFIARQTKDGLFHAQIECFGYTKEREEFNKLIDDLYQKNTDNFSSREEIFNVFATSMLKGDILPVLKLIKNTYGAEEMKKFVKSQIEIIEPEEETKENPKVN